MTTYVRTLDLAGAPALTVLGAVLPNAHEVKLAATKTGAAS